MYIYIYVYINCTIINRKRLISLAISNVIVSNLLSNWRSTTQNYQTEQLKNITIGVT